MIGPSSFSLPFPHPPITPLVRFIPFTGHLSFSMRYEAWDVLLFEDGHDSTVPIQEFKTQCFVIKDTESPYLYQSDLNPGFGPYGDSGAYGPLQGSYGQIPVVTTFIPSLPKDTAFRVSIHNWDVNPKPSALMESLLQRDDHAAFEARVLIDGVLAGYVFDPVSSDGSALTTRFLEKA